MPITTRIVEMKITRRLASLSLATCLLGVAEFSVQTMKAQERPQTVTMQIEYRGGQEMHLHLKKGTVLRFSKKSPVTWNVHILPIKEKGEDRRPKEVIVWFPRPVLKDSKEPGQVFLREITFRDFDYSERDGIGRASRELTPNPEFQLVGDEITAIPLGIYTDIDEGQDEVVGKRPSSRKNVFKQPGLQMVDGANSNPQCQVGP
jgi:hypothetical protein